MLGWLLCLLLLGCLLLGLLGCVVRMLGRMLIVAGLCVGIGQSILLVVGLIGLGVLFHEQSGKWLRLQGLVKGTGLPG